MKKSTPIFTFTSADASRRPGYLARKFALIRHRMKMEAEAKVQVDSKKIKAIR